MIDEYSRAQVSNIEDEQIDIVRIKLVRPGGSAVVCEWHAADLLLSRWAEHEGLQSSLGFEVVFGDGNSLRGRYVYEPKAGRRPSLSRYIRRVFQQLRDASEPVLEADCAFTIRPADLARYAIRCE